jgi:hypothetical protein
MMKGRGATLIAECALILLDAMSAMPLMTSQLATRPTGAATA